MITSIGKFPQQIGDRHSLIINLKHLYINPTDIFALQSDDFDPFLGYSWINNWRTTKGDSNSSMIAKDSENYIVPIPKIKYLDIQFRYIKSPVLMIEYLVSPQAWAVFYSVVQRLKRDVIPTLSIEAIETYGYLFSNTLDWTNHLPKPPLWT